MWGTGILWTILLLGLCSSTSASDESITSTTTQTKPTTVASSSTVSASMTNETTSTTPLSTKGSSEISTSTIFSTASQGSTTSPPKATPTATTPATTEKSEAPGHSSTITTITTITTDKKDLPTSHTSVTPSTVITSTRPTVTPTTTANVKKSETNATSSSSSPETTTQTASSTTLSAQSSSSSGQTASVQTSGSVQSSPTTTVLSSTTGSVTYVTTRTSPSKAVTAPASFGTSTRPATTKEEKEESKLKNFTEVFTWDDIQDPAKRVDPRVQVCLELLQKLKVSGNCTLTGTRQEEDKETTFAFVSLTVDPSAAQQIYNTLEKPESEPTPVPKTLIAILSSCGALVLFLICFALYCMHHHRSYRKNQQHLTEELQTVENGYHDNPTLEVMEVQPEMQEKKLTLNGEFNDSWIVPFDNLAKEVPDEEDTHL